jgi:hypothetical protein
MSGTYRHLEPGRYQLYVASGQGPAGIRRPDGRDVVVGVNGGSQSFSLDRGERIYFWWRGPRPRSGVRLVPDQAPRAARTGPANELAGAEG